MPTPWFRRFRQAGELSVFNKAGVWASAADRALATFNTLGFPVRLVRTEDEKNALIVVKLSTGPDSQESWGKKASTNGNFDAARLHGLTVPLTEIHERKKTFEARLTDTASQATRVRITYELAGVARDAMIVKLYTGGYSQDIRTLDKSAVAEGLWSRAFGRSAHRSA